MGDWHISIRGTGCHHNKDYPQDAEKMAADFVAVLKEAGHHIEGADFTYGCRERIRVPCNCGPGAVCSNCPPERFATGAETPA